MKNKHAGFTLIELLIVISIIAILAVNAIPAYSQYLQKARRADAHTALLSLQLAQEKFRVNCPSYATTIGSANNCTTGTVKGASTSSEGYYDLTIVSADDTTYALKATPATGEAQENDTSCSTIEIDQESTKNEPDCW
ncbi:MAG TPA: prepilin-type N-terminal cleavage/methylation domain-containing protein [Methylococcaceae bacterium]|nr:prepilin-type N-terminal cleavage/methylation domain-containing protein [Methylococcaceae bacterium]